MKLILILVFILISLPANALTFQQHIAEVCGTLPKVDVKDGTIPAECIKDGIIWDVTTIKDNYDKVLLRAVNYGIKTNNKPGIAVIVYTQEQCKLYHILKDSVESIRVNLGVSPFGIPTDIVKIKLIQLGAIRCEITVSGRVN